MSNNIITINDYDEGQILIFDKYIVGGDMHKYIYDTNNSGIVDNSEKLNGYNKQQIIDTIINIYDTNHNGIVDNSEKLNGYNKQQIIDEVISQFPIDGTLPPLPFQTGGYSGLVNDGQFIYIPRRENTVEFWKFSLTDYTYTRLTDCPQLLQTSGGMGWDGQRYIYLGKGGNTISNNWLRYDTLSNVWATLGASNFVRSNVQIGVGNGNNKIFGLWDGKIFSPSSDCSYTNVSLNSPYNTIDEDTGQITLNSESINGFVYLASYTLRQPMGATGCIPYYDGSFYYVFGDDTPVFGKYSVNTNTWTKLTDTPAGCDWASMTKDIYIDGQNKYLFVLRGEDDSPGAGVDTNNFWRYNITNDTWDIMTSLPFTTDSGAILLVGNWVYASRGTNTFSTALYHIPSNTWTQWKDIELQMLRGSFTSISTIKKENRYLVNYILNGGSTTNSLYSKWIIIYG